MYRLDYHVHTHFSFDSEESILAIGQTALEKGLDEIGISDHFSVNPADKSFGLYSYAQAREEFLEAAEKISIPFKFGLEIGEGQYRKEILEDFLRYSEYDYIIGSVHNIGDLTIRQYIRAYGIDAAYEAYFEELLKLAEEGDYDILGHFDLIQRYAFDEQGVYRESGYEDWIDMILKAVIRRGKALEINSSTRLKNSHHFMPNRGILIRYRELGGESIVFGSDAHQRTRIGESLKEVGELLKDLGFREITTYHHRVPDRKRL